MGLTVARDGSGLGQTAVRDGSGTGLDWSPERRAPDTVHRVTVTLTDSGGDMNIKL